MSIAERLLVVIDADAKGAIREVDKLGDRAVKLGVGQEKVTGLTNALKGLAGPAAVTAAIFAAEAAVIATTVGAYTNYASKVREVQRVSGATAEEASGLTYAFEKVGIGATAGAKAVFQLEKRIGDGKVNLAKYGTEVERTATGGVDLVGTLGNIADAYQKTTDPAKRASLVMAAFGRQGQALIPILASGRQGIKDLFDEAGRTNHLLDQGDLDRAKQFTMATRELGQTFDGVKIKLGNAFTPALTQLTETGTSLVQIADKAHVFDVLATGAKAWADELAGPVTLIKSFTDEIGVTSSHVNLAKAAQDQYNRALNAYNDAMSSSGPKSRAALAAQRELTRTQRVLTAVQNQYLKATGQTQAAQEALAQKSDTYKTAIRGVTAAREAERSGEVDSITAAKNLAAAYDQVTAAKEREAAAISNSLSTMLSVEGATRTLNEDLMHLNDGTAQSTDNFKIQQDAVALAQAKVADYGAIVQATTGHTLTARESMQLQLRALQDLAAQNPETAASVAPLILKMQWLIDHSNIDPTITAHTNGEGDVDRVIGKIERIKASDGSTVNIYVKTHDDSSHGHHSLNYDGSIDFDHDPTTPGRALGGSALRGKTYVVGERGPELLTMGAGSGWITPNNKLGGGNTYTINVSTPVVTADTGRQIVEHIRAYERNSGSRWRQN